MKSNSHDTALESQVAAVRGFSRFYTRKLGIIEPKLLHSTFTLQEARIIYELAHRENCTATDLVRDLDLDAGFVSRTLQALQKRQIVTRKPSKADKRVNEVALTAKGCTAAADLDRRSRSEVGALLKQMDGDRRAAVVRAMGTIRWTATVARRWCARWARSSNRWSLRPGSRSASCCAAIASATWAG
ncbi:DNA-binding MarR family transcriptional regulator [Bradyrhizobium elkanii]